MDNLGSNLNARKEQALPVLLLLPTCLAVDCFCCSYFLKVSNILSLPPFQILLVFYFFSQYKHHEKRAINQHNTSSQTLWLSNHPDFDSLFRRPSLFVARHMPSLPVDPGHRHDRSCVTNRRGTGFVPCTPLDTAHDLFCIHRRLKWSTPCGVSAFCLLHSLHILRPLWRQACRKRQTGRRMATSDKRLTHNSVFGQRKD